MQTIFEAEASDAVRFTERHKRRRLDADHRGDRDQPAGGEERTGRRHDVSSETLPLHIEGPRKCSLGPSFGGGSYIRDEIEIS